MGRAPFQSIFIRLLAGLLGLVLLAIVPAAYLTFQSYRDSLSRHYAQEVEAVAQGLASASFNAVASHDQPSLQGIVVEMVESTPADIAIVVDREGRVWAQSGDHELGVAFAGLATAQWVSTAVEIRAGGRTLGTAHVGILRSKLAAEASRPLGMMGLGFALVLLMASGLAVYVSLSTARPIRTLTEAARQIANGDLEHPLGEIRGPAEVRTMARAFEEMRQSLSRTLAQRNDSYRQLDRRVRELTVLYGASEAMNAGDYTEGLLDTLLIRTVKGLRARFGALWLIEGEEGDGARLVATTGLVRRGERGPLFRNFEAIANQSRTSGAAATGHCPAGEPEPSDVHIAAQPLVVQDQVAGMLAIARAETTFSEEDLDLLEALASHAARCVERSQLHAAAITDGLTGLFVSRHFRQRLQDEVWTAARYGRSLSVVMVDIDYFKRVNDTHGHQAGDEVLRVVARCLLDTVREGTDIAARYGGEEFALILPETDLEGATSLSERLRELIGEQSILFGGQFIEVTASLGVATFPDAGERPQDLVEAADQALYRAKRGGRNRVESASSR